MFLSIKMQRLCKSHNLHNIIKSFRETGEISVFKGQDRRPCWMHVVFGPSDNTASLIGMILSLTLLNGPRNTSRNDCRKHNLRAMCRCQLKLYHAKRKPYVNMVQKRCRVLWAKAHLKWTVLKWKMFNAQMSPNVTFLLEITDAMSSRLKRRETETFLRVISVQ